MNTKVAGRSRGHLRPAHSQELQSPAAAQTTMIEASFEALSAASQEIVEHHTIPGFLRLIDHRWNLDDIRRFGDKMQQMAEALSLAYVTTSERSLGIIRMFPKPLLRRVYDTLQPQYGWPQIVDVETPALEDAKRKRDEVRSNERTVKRLREIIAETDDVTALQQLSASVEILEARTAALRGEVPMGAGAMEAGAVTTKT